MSTKIWALVCGAAAALVLVAGWFVGVQPQVAAAAAADGSTREVESSNLTLEARLAALAKLGARQEAMTAEDRVVRKSVPTILKANMLIRRINELAPLNNVSIESIALGSAAPYTAPASATKSATVPAATGTTPAPSPSPSAAASSPVPAAPAEPTAPLLALTDPSVTAENFVTVPATLTVNGSKDDILVFSTALQNDERVFLLNKVGLSKTEGTDAYTGTLAGYVYTLKR